MRCVAGQDGLLASVDLDLNVIVSAEEPEPNIAI
jgi:hypothetical protein